MLYPFPTMKVGDAYTYLYNDPDHTKVYIRVRTSVQRWGRINHRKFTVEQTPEGVLFKRIE